MDVVTRWYSSSFVFFLCLSTRTSRFLGISSDFDRPRVSSSHSCLEYFRFVRPLSHVRSGRRRFGCVEFLPSSHQNHSLRGRGYQYGRDEIPWQPWIRYRYCVRSTRTQVSLALGKEEPSNDIEKSWNMSSSAAAVIEASERINEVHIEGLVRLDQA